MGFIATAMERRAEKLPPRGIHRLEDPRYIFGTHLPDNHTGLDLSEGEVMGWPAVLQALRIIGWSLGQMPLQVFEIDTQGARKLTPADNHPLQPLLQEAPHPDITPFELKNGIGVNAAFRGDSFAHVARERNGRIRYILPLDSHRMRTERVNGRRWYTYNDNGKNVVMPPEEVLQISGFSDGGIVGFAIQQMAATSFAKGVAMDRFGARVFKNGASGNAIVESTQPFKFPDKAAEKEFYDKLADNLSGPANWHKVTGLPYGMTIKTLGITAKEAQLIEGLVYQVQDIARLTGVPPSLLMDNSHNTFTNSEQQFLQFIKMGLGGWIVNIEERMRLTLLSSEERKRYTIKFNADALLRTSLKERYEAYRIAVGVPFMSRNEARDLEDMEPVDGGDLIQDPLNMNNPGGNPDITDEGGDGATTPPQDGDSDTRDLSCPRPCCTTRSEPTTREYRNAGRAGYLTTERRAEIREQSRERIALRRAFQNQIRRDAQRLVRGEVREINKALGKHLKERAATDFLKAMQAYYEGDGARSFAQAARNILGGTFETFGEAIAAAIGREQNQDAPDVAAFIRAYMDSFIKRTAGGHFGQLRKLTEESEDAIAAITKRLEEWEEEPASQAEKIADREGVQLGEAVARAALASLGVTRLAWVANSGACPLCDELDGRIVGIDSVFVEKSGQVDPDDDEVTPMRVQTDVNNPPLHQGCECSLAAA